jgi:hypothetical protein
MFRKIQGQGKLVLRRFAASATQRRPRPSATSLSPPKGSRRSTSCASSKRALPPSTSGPGLAAQSVPRPLRPKTCDASHRTGHATKGAAQYSRRLPRIVRLSDR